jgi:glycosyltransferase involved in cell wall biosynthesis
MEAVAQAQVNSLIDKGHKVEVITCSHARRLAMREQDAGYMLRRVRALNFLERRFGVTFPLIGVRAAAAIARSVRRADMVHVHDVFYMTSWIAFLAAVVQRRNIYLTQHVAMVDHPNRGVMAVQKLIYATIGKLMFRRVQRIVVYNARVRDFVIGLGAHPSNVVLNYNGIDTSAFSPVSHEERLELRKRYQLPVDRPIALFVGRLVPKKGFDLVMRAACPEYLTLLVGEGTDLPASTPDMYVFGPADTSQLAHLYRLSDVFVFPAVGEMLTLVMQEAMASGLPVVTTDDPHYSEYGLDRDNICFVERDPQIIRRAVIEIVGSRERRLAMGSYSRWLALERFSWNVNYEREYAIYLTNESPACPVKSTDVSHFAG